MREVRYRFFSSHQYEMEKKEYMFAPIRCLYSTSVPSQSSLRNNSGVGREEVQPQRGTIWIYHITN